MIKKFWVLILLTTCLTSFAQVGTWESLPTMTEIRALLPLQNQVILASNGGIMTVDKTTGAFEYGIKGLQTDNYDVITVFIDSDSLLWIGSKSPGPIVEVISLKTGVRQPVEFVDLDQANSFTQVGDSIYTTYQDGLEGGILLYRKKAAKIEYLDLFNNFPAQSTLDLTSIGDVICQKGKLLFRTTKHILWVDLNGSNLKDPANWNVTAIPTGNTKINRLLEYGDELLLAMDNKLYSYDYLEFNELVKLGTTVLDLAQDPLNPNRIVLASTSGIFEYNIDSGSIDQLAELAGIHSIGIQDTAIWVASNTDFLSVLTEATYEIFSANRPIDHLFNRILSSATGQLVGAAINGISIHSEKGWRTIRPGITNSFGPEQYNWDALIVDTLAYGGNAVVEDMIIDHFGSIYLSLQGRGVFKFGDEPVFYDAENGVLEPTFDSDTYILPTQMALDSHGNVWITTKFVREGGSVLTILGADQEIYHIKQYQGGLDTRMVKSIAIDDNDLVWIGSQIASDLQASGGIHLIENYGDLDQQAGLSVSSLIGSPLASNEILQLEVDARNTLWILTPAGVQSMPLPDEFLNSTELRNWARLYMTRNDADLYYYWQLTDYNVTGIEIDQRGHHWFLSSNAGVHVLQDNGRWINGGFGYNTANSDLLDNEIHSVTFNAESGQAFFSTPKGISILNTPFANPKENYSSIHIYPQPFNPNIHDKVIIQGLMDNSAVKVLTISGTLVKELSSESNEVQGFEAHWDGRDTAGDLVGSGVYILYLFNDDGAASSQKLAILR